MPELDTEGRMVSPEEDTFGGMSADELHQIVRGEIEQAIDFVEHEIGPDRAESTRYYRGEKLGNEEEGRSQIVSRDVRDAVRQVLPSLMRVFFGSERAVEFVPTGPEDVAHADQATDYVNHILLQDNPGFQVFHTVFKDSLYNKTGVVKYWLDESTEVTYHEFSGLNDVGLGLMLEEPSVDPVEIRSVPDAELAGLYMMQGMEPPMVHSGRVRRTRVSPRVRVMAVPPEEFLIDRNAKDIDSARYVGHRCLMSFSDLVALGYDPELLKDKIYHSERLTQSEEAQARYSHLGGVWPDDVKNPSEKKILYTESYVRIDVDGDEIGELRKVCTVGDGYEVVNGEGLGEPVSERPFASFCPDPEPHLFFGSDVADMTKDIQKIRTMVMRALLDSLAQSIHPRTAVVEGQVNIEDALNTEVGAIIRQNAPGMVTPFTVPFVGADALPVLGLLQEERDSRIGVHNLALEADALQSTTKAAVDAQVDASRQNLELVARIYAEGGMRRLFKGLLKLVIAHQDRPRMVRLRNEWVEIDPREWNASMDVSVNVGLGNGMTEDRLRALGQILTVQREVLQTMGPSNPLVGLGQVRNTMARMAELSGYKDTAQFFKPIPIDFELPPPEPKPSPEELLAQVEREKTMADMQNDTARLELDRDKLYSDILLKVKEIEAKYQTAIDVAGIRRSIEENRLQRSKS